MAGKDKIYIFFNILLDVCECEHHVMLYNHLCGCLVLPVVLYVG